MTDKLARVGSALFTVGNGGGGSEAMVGSNQIPQAGQ